MNKTYDRINWKNYPSDKTPLNEQNLNKIDVAVNTIDDRVITLDETKATKIEVSTLFKEVSYEEQTGIITFTRKNGATVTIDTPMEKIQTGIYYNPTTEKLVLPLIDGTSMEVDLSRLMKFDEFIDSDTIAFSVKSNGTVTAIVKEGSIEEKHLRPNYLAEIKVEVAKAESAAVSAETSKTASAASASTASNKASEASASAASAANSASTATQKATEATKSATNAENSANTATTKANAADASATNAANSAMNASNSATTATNKASAAATSATNASTSATNADTYAKKSQSYAVGTGNVRPNEATDSAKYYYEQAKSISESFSGALRPMGTVTFANLPALSNAVEGDMYNVSDQFTTNANFKEGAGNVIPAGSNVYKTADNKWDVLAGSPVTGVKGNAENTYRKGNVNLTPANIGAAPISHASTDTTYGVSTAVNYGHAMASSTTPKENGTATVGTETAKFARGDHVHPAQTSVSGNAGTATKLATARTIDGVSFNGTAAITHYGTCSTAAGTAAKVVACVGFTLVTGATIRVKFTVTNTASNPNLNVNGTGAKAVYYRGAAITAGYLAANRTYEFVYNGTQYELVGDIDTNTTITRQSVTSSSKNIEIAPKSFAVYDFSFPFSLNGITILTFEMGWGANAYPRAFLGKSGNAKILPVLFYNDTAGGMTLSGVTVTIYYTTNI